MKIFAHRGFSGRYPQNTMLAFQKALESGCDGIELDVQLTKDGVPVIIHDEYLDDLTDFKGFVRDYTYEQLKKCNAAGKYNETYGFCPTPTFQEYCEWVKQTELITNVEIKSSVYYYEDIEEKVMDLIERYGLADRIILSSFNHLSAVRCKELRPGLCTGALTENGGIENAGLYCSKFGFDCYHPGLEGLTEQEVENCHRHGVKVNVWTVNGMEDLENIYEWGCDGAITNFPDVCKSWVEAKERNR